LRRERLRRKTGLFVVTGVMNRTFRTLSFVSAVAFTGLIVGCQPGGVGDPCVPEDEYQRDFSGFSVEEVNVESRSFQCETRICLVNHFRGRVSCPYGNDSSSVNVSNSEKPGDCYIPGSKDKVEVPAAGGQMAAAVAVDPQVKKRQAADAVYCSCRCDGPDANARYCECPSGFSCAKLVDKLPIGEGAQLAGSYCIRENTDYVKTSDLFEVCKKSLLDCGDVTDQNEPK
jgi:hypothetical protein